MGYVTYASLGEILEEGNAELSLPMRGVLVRKGCAGKAIQDWRQDQQRR